MSMQSTTVMSNSAPSHEYASSAEAQPARRIPAYVPPMDSSSSPEPRRRRCAPHPDEVIESVEEYEHVEPPYCRVLNNLRTDADALPREAHELIIRQQPGTGKVFIGKEKGMLTSQNRGFLFTFLDTFYGEADKCKDRKPIDPPPVVQLVIDDGYDQRRNYLHSP